jgi:hypothetical protein
MTKAIFRLVQFMRRWAHRTVGKMDAAYTDLMRYSLTRHAISTMPQSVDRGASAIT